MIKDLIEDQADMVVAPISLTFARSHFIDYCLPFYRDTYFYYIRYYHLGRLGV